NGVSDRLRRKSVSIHRKAALTPARWKSRLAENLRGNSPEALRKPPVIANNQHERNIRYKLSGGTSCMLPISPITDLYRPAEGFYASTVETPRPLPVVTFLPTGYEPRYAYPLLVFFHGRGGNERQLLRLAPRVSRRNYLSIGVRGQQTVLDRTTGKRGFGWAADLTTESLTEDYVFSAIEQTFQSYNVHPDRIFLVGFCEGATQALRM